MNVYVFLKKREGEREGGKEGGSEGKGGTHPIKYSSTERIVSYVWGVGVQQTEKAAIEETRKE